MENLDPQVATQKEIVLEFPGTVTGFLSESYLLENC